ncbi:MAG: right-handed parallel beta-helix repeat-containing protein [Owenweeksia sp.]|nr:right-handed parallel beta-helix repeat-containing protein [Owenweeksia sp.]
MVLTIYNISTSSHVNGLTVANCQFEDIYYYGVRSYYNDSVQIVDNHFDPFRNNTTGYGIYIYYNDVVEVTGNEVQSVGTYALYSYYTNDGSTSNTSTIANNLLNGRGTYGVYMYSNNNLNFYHNTINGGTHGMYLGGSTASNFSTSIFATTYLPLTVRAEGFGLLPLH